MSRESGADGTTNRLGLLAVECARRVPHSANVEILILPPRTVMIA